MRQSMTCTLCADCDLLVWQPLSPQTPQLCAFSLSIKNSDDECNNGGESQNNHKNECGLVPCVIFPATKMMLIGISNGYIKALNAKTM